MRIGLFLTCLNDSLFPGVGTATATVLEGLGHGVDFPRGQTCCGQMHWNSGYRAQALPLIRRTVDVLAPYETVVCPSASCAAMIREHYLVAAEQAGDTQLADRVLELRGRVFELSELLVDRLGVEDVGAALRARAAYHPTCHSLRSLRVGDRPLRLLRAVRGLELLEHERATECCGFGGTFAVKNDATSVAMGLDKARAVATSGADLVIAADRSCLMQIGGILDRQRIPVRTLHLAEVLACREDV